MLPFLPSPIARKDLGFPVPEDSGSKVSTILKKFVSKVSLEAAILNLSWQPGYVYVMSFDPIRNWQQGEKSTTDLVFFTRSAKSIVSQRIFHFTIFNVIISEFGACLAQNNMAQEQP